MKFSHEERQLRRHNMMLEDSLPSVIMRMAFPTIIAFLINSIYSLADTYFVSFLGTNATAAVSVNTSLDQIIMMAGSMLAVGANSYIARLLGAGETEKANRVLSTSFYLAAIVGTVFAVLGMAFMHPMIRLLGATPTCEQYAIDYATYVLLVAPFMATSFVMNQCLRAEGSAMLSMIGMGFGGILNCVLDPIFVFTLDLGVAGASMATAISKLVSFGILIFPYVTHRSLLRIKVRLIECSRDIIGQIVSIGSSSMFRTALSVVAAIVLNNIAGSISDSVLAGIGVTTKVMMFPFGIVLGFGNGFQPVAGFNWGAKRFERVRQSFRFASWVSLVGGAVMGALLFVFARQTIGIFTVGDAEMMEIGMLSIRLQSIAMPIHAWVAVVNMFCAGLGNARGALLLSTARQGTCFLPIVHLMAYLWGAVGVASVQAVADGLSLLLALPILRGMMRKVDFAEKEHLQSTVEGVSSVEAEAEKEHEAAAALTGEEA